MPLTKRTKVNCLSALFNGSNGQLGTGTFISGCLLVCTSCFLKTG